MRHQTIISVTLQSMLARQSKGINSGDLALTPFYLAEGTNLYLDQALMNQRKELEPVMEEIIEEEEEEEEEELSPLDTYLLAFLNTPLEQSQSYFGIGWDSSDTLLPALSRGDAVILQSAGPSTLDQNLDFTPRATRAARAGETVIATTGGRGDASGTDAAGATETGTGGRDDTA